MLLSPPVVRKSTAFVHDTPRTVTVFLFRDMSSVPLVSVGGETGKYIRKILSHFQKIANKVTFHKFCFSDSKLEHQLAVDTSRSKGQRKTCATRSKPLGAVQHTSLSLTSFNLRNSVRREQPRIADTSSADMLSCFISSSARFRSASVRLRGSSTYNTTFS